MVLHLVPCFCKGETPCILRTAYCFILSLRTEYGLSLALRTAYRLTTKQPLLAFPFTLIK